MVRFTDLKLCPFKDLGLAGKCVEGFENFKISEIKFHFHYTSEQKNVRWVKTSYYRRAAYIRWNPHKGIVALDDRDSIGLYVKQSRIRGIGKRLGRFFQKTKSRQEWDLGRALLDKNIPTAEPVIWCEGKLDDEEYSSYLVLSEIENTTDFRKFLEMISDKNQINSSLYMCLDLISSLHKIGFYHDDLSAKNVLIKSSGLQGAENLTKRQFYIIDLDGGKFFSTFSRIKKLLNLYHFLKSLPLKINSRRKRLRLFCYYLMKYEGIGLSQKNRSRRYIRLLLLYNLFRLKGCKF